MDENGWTKVEHSLPYDGQLVNTYCQDAAEEIGYYYWLMGCTVFRHGVFYAGSYYKITHWCPAPLPPKR